MTSGTISSRTSSLRCRGAAAVCASASPTPAHRPTHPRLICRRLESHLSARSWRTSSSATHRASEQPKPIYYRPQARPQASAPSCTRCATRASSARRGHPQPQEAREWLVFDASFHSGPEPGQGPKEARRGDHWAARGACAREVGVDGRFGYFSADRRLCGVCYDVSSRAQAEVSVPFERVGIGLQTMCSSAGGAHTLPPNTASENSDFVLYEGKRRARQRAP